MLKWFRKDLTDRLSRVKRGVRVLEDVLNLLERVLSSVPRSVREGISLEGHIAGPVRVEPNDATGECRLAGPRLADDRRAGLRVDVEVDVEEHALATVGGLYTPQLEQRVAGLGERGGECRSAGRRLMFDVVCPHATHVPITDSDGYRSLNKAIAERVRASWREGATLRPASRTGRLAFDPSQHLCALG